MKKITEAEFTEEEVTKVFEDVVLEFGANYKYPTQEENPEYWSDTKSCIYVTDGGEVACIVGQIYHRLGATTQQLQGNRGAIDKGRELGFVFPANVQLGLSRAQGAQDYGETWGQALDEYKLQVFEV